MIATIMRLLYWHDHWYGRLGIGGPLSTEAAVAIWRAHT